MQLGGNGTTITVRNNRECTDAGGIPSGTVCGGAAPTTGLTSGSTRTSCMVNCFIPAPAPVAPAPAPAPVITVSHHSDSS